MKKSTLLASLSFIAAFCASTTLFAATNENHAADAGLKPAQVKQIEKVVHDYLVTNPQVLVEASRALQQQEMTKMQANARDAISKNAKELFNDATSPILGNTQGDVTLVEFMDYQCGHCKEMAATVDQLKQKDSNLRIVIKELPIFGESSEYAAKAALASQKQDKFAAFHQALLSATQPLSHDKVAEIAKSVGIDTDKLQQEMQNNTYDQQLQANMQLAQSLGLMGTPAFIIGNRQGTKNAFIPGATSLDNLQKTIAQVRSAK